MKNIDVKSLMIGLLVGLCLCLAFALVTQGPRPALAAGSAGPARYQLEVAGGTSRSYYVMDQCTGYLYEANLIDRTWKLKLRGPPRGK